MAHCQRSTELSSASGDLLRVVDQDPGLWLGERGNGPRGVVWGSDECPVSSVGKNGIGPVKCMGIGGMEIGNEGIINEMR